MRKIILFDGDNARTLSRYVGLPVCKTRERLRSLARETLHKYEPTIAICVTSRQYRFGNAVYDVVKSGQYDCILSYEYELTPRNRLDHIIILTMGHRSAKCYKRYLGYKRINLKNSWLAYANNEGDC